MAKILINDGIHPSGLKVLTDAGHEVHTNKIEQADLSTKLQDYDAICVRSATKVRQELIDQCPNLKFIGRGGVGMDNIDVDYARSKGIAVHNTPAASSRSVAELSFGHLMSMARSVYQSNREMPKRGNTDFGTLKKAYGKGVELEGKTLGIIGLGRIGMEAAKIGFGLGMNVVGVDPFVKGSKNLNWNIAGQSIEVSVPSVSMDEMLSQADFITMHIPFTGAPVLGKSEFQKMKKGAFLVDAARGGTIDEDALIEALDNGTVAAAGLDVFVNEPTPRADILNHAKISLTPHIGAATAEAQEKIGTEMAGKIIEVFENLS